MSCPSVDEPVSQEMVIGVSSLKKVFVVSLDGATFDVLRPLMQQGYVPHLAQIRYEDAGNIPSEQAQMGYSAQDAELIGQRLKGLGYLE